jgi:hypothetical protein
LFFEFSGDHHCRRVCAASSSIRPGLCGAAGSISLAMPLPVGAVLVVIPLVVILVPAVVNALVFATVIPVAVIVAVLRQHCEWRSQAAGQQQRTQITDSLVPHFLLLGVCV